MARDILCIPAAGTGVERVFKDARDVCYYRRSRLQATTIRATMILRHYDRVGLATDALRESLADTMLVDELRSVDIEEEEVRRNKEVEEDIDSQYISDEEGQMQAQWHFRKQRLIKRSKRTQALGQTPTPERESRTRMLIERSDQDAQAEHSIYEQFDESPVRPGDHVSRAITPTTLSGSPKPHSQPRGRDHNTVANMFHGKELTLPPMKRKAINALDDAIRKKR